MKKSATKKNYSFAIGFVFLLVLLAALVFVLFIPNKKQEAVKEIVKPTIAFVNEDVPADFNNESYSFGKNFVDLVSNDMDYNWQVVSRAVADRAYGDKSVDAVIYLPQTFSRDILTLQDIEPTKAQVEYKVQRQSDKLSDKMLQSKIGEVLYDFNQRVVKMYYASVANNIAEAESNMNAFVGDQEKLVVNLESQVNDPFKEALPGYSVLLSGANGLKSMNEANVSLQNGFTQVTTDMLKRTGETFDNQLPQVTEYFELQKKISTINVVNGNKGISDQAMADQKFYHNQFTTLYDNTRAGLSPFYSKNKTGDESGLLGELKQKISHYKPEYPVSAIR